MDVQLISGSTCPFAHRTRIVLLEKQIRHEFIAIDLADKPSWFLDISPYEKVPVLRHGPDVVLYESGVIGEYLDEVFPEPALMPPHPVSRAQVRIWVHFADTRFIPHVYRIMLARTAHKARSEAQKLTDALGFVECSAFAGGGDYIVGDRLTLADVALYPHLERFVALEHYRGFAIPETCGELKAWMDRIGQRPAVRALRRPHRDYIEAWRKYAEGEPTGVTAREMAANDGS